MPELWHCDFWDFFKHYLPKESLPDVAAKFRDFDEARLDRICQAFEMDLDSLSTAVEWLHYKRGGGSLGLHWFDLSTEETEKMHAVTRAL